MCQPMPTRFYTRGDHDSEADRFTPRLNKTRNFEKLVKSYFRRTRPESEGKSLYKTTDTGKLIASVLKNFILPTTPCLKQWAAFTTLVPVKSYVHLSLKKISNLAERRGNLMHLEQAKYKRKHSVSLHYGSGNSIKQTILLNNISENNSLTGVHLQLGNY